MTAMEGPTHVPAGVPAGAPPRRDTGAVPHVEMRDIKVSFGGVHAVNGVSIDLRLGEVVGPGGRQRRGQVDAHEGAVGGSDA